MMPGHGTRSNLPFKPVSNYEVVSRFPLLNKFWRLGKIVAVIGVPHHNKIASRVLDSLPQCAAVSTRSSVHHSRAVRLGDLNRTVRRTVIGNDDFPDNFHTPECSLRLFNAKADRLCLV